MAEGIKPIRRVVTGNDARGRSKVLYDGPAPGVKASAFKKGTGMTDIWQFDTCPASIAGDRDEGNRPFHFEPPATGGCLRIVQSDPKPASYDPARTRTSRRSTNRARPKAERGNAEGRISSPRASTNRRPWITGYS